MTAKPSSTDTFHGAAAEREPDKYTCDREKDSIRTAGKRHIVDEPMPRLTLILFGSDGTSVGHDDRERAIELNTGVCRSHLQTRRVFNLYMTVSVIARGLSNSGNLRSLVKSWPGWMVPMPS